MAENEFLAKSDPKAESALKKKIRSSAKLHWFHWAVVLASLVLTIGAWKFSKNQIDAKVRLQFEREASQVLELLRMFQLI